VVASIKSRKNALIGAAVLGALVICIFAASDKAQVNEWTALEWAFGTRIVAPGETASERRLEWFVEANRLDPIFALEGTDPDELEESLAYLEAQRDAFAQYYSESDAETIRTSLYPMQFLRLLPELERTRQNMLAEPSTEKALAYSALLVRTIDSYEADARNLARALQHLDLSTYRFVYVGGSTKTDVMASTLLEIAGRAEYQKQKIL
jgi:hypothetical protein